MKFAYDVCFVGLKCYDLLTHVETPRYLGGIERMLITLSRGLAREGLSVAFITYDHGGQKEETVDSIHIQKAYAPNSGIRGLRFIHPKMTALWSAMAAVDARTYVQMGAEVDTATVAAGITKLRVSSDRRFVFCVASDGDCYQDLPLMTTRIEKPFYRWGLKRSNCIVAQSIHQQQLLKDQFGRDSIVIPMPHDAENNIRTPDKNICNNDIRVLWVGRIVEVKRLEVLLDLAQKFPGIQFDVAGSANHNSNYATKVTDRGREMPNVTIHGRVSDSALQSLYRKSHILCCTSSMEGFPTTFLEAWSHGVPVVTTFDPDGIVEANQTGVVSKTVEGLAHALTSLLQAPSSYQAMAKRAFDFYQSNYTSKVIAPQFSRMLKSL